MMRFQGNVKEIDINCASKSSLKQWNLGRANIHENSDYFVKVLHQKRERELKTKGWRERKGLKREKIMVGKEFKLKKFFV